MLNKFLCFMWGCSMTYKSEIIDIEPYKLEIEYHECKHCGARK